MHTIEITRYAARNWGWVVTNEVGGSSGSHALTQKAAVAAALRAVPASQTHAELVVERPREYGGSGETTHHFITRA